MQDAAKPLGDCQHPRRLVFWDDDRSGLPDRSRGYRNGVDAIEGDAMTTPVQVDADAMATKVDQNVHVYLSLRAPVGAVWEALVSPKGTATWLGEGAVLGDKGQSYHCADGTAGVVRSFHPLEQLRLSWHQQEDSEPGLIEIDVSVEGAGTGLRLWHDGLPEQERPAMQAHWQQRLEALAQLVPQSAT
jgi:uncharacterized protein YndB with AHSA1/START domain